VRRIADGIANGRTVLGAEFPGFHVASPGDRGEVASQGEGQGAKRQRALYLPCTVLGERASVGSLAISEQAAAGMQVYLAAVHRLHGKANQVAALRSVRKESPSVVEACFPARKSESEVGVGFRRRGGVDLSRSPFQ
jgi:hypothetical protein